LEEEQSMEAELLRGLDQGEVEAATERLEAAQGEAVSCLVCLAPLLAREATLSLRRCPCRLAFHAACLVRWLAARGTCPHCRGAARGQGGH
jgi:hypothetical protein